MLADQPLVFGEVVGFDRQIGRVHRFRTGRRAEKSDERVRFLFRGKAAEPILRHRGRRMPERELNSAALIDSQSPVLDLKPAGQMGRTFQRHDGRIIT